jgi:hypothetical protein
LFAQSARRFPFLSACLFYGGHRNSPASDALSV